MSRFVVDICQARSRGRLPERFRAADVRKACPGWKERTYTNSPRRKPSRLYRVL